MDCAPLKPLLVREILHTAGTASDTESCRDLDLPVGDLKYTGSVSDTEVAKTLTYQWVTSNTQVL